MYRSRDFSDQKPIWQKNQPEAPLPGVGGLGGAGSQPEDLPLRLPAIWETRVESLGQEDPLEKKMATHSSTLAWKIPWMEEPGMPAMQNT